MQSPLLNAMNKTDKTDTILRTCMRTWVHVRPRLSMSGKGGMREMALFLPTDASLSLNGGFTLNVVSASSHPTQPISVLARLTLVLFFMMPITFSDCGPAVLFDRPFCPLRQPTDRQTGSERADRSITLAAAVPYDSPFAFFAYPSVGLLLALSSPVSPSWGASRSDSFGLGTNPLLPPAAPRPINGALD